MSRRVEAVQAVERRCPRCGAARRSRGQRHCRECGLALPALGGSLAAGRRAWLAHVGWYPGDAVFAVLALAALAAGGGAAAVTLGGWRTADHPGTLLAAPPATVPVAPPGRTRPGETRWPASVQGWTVVLASLPASGGFAPAHALAESAARAGLPEVGVLDSSAYASLQPGYVVVFSGVYGARRDALTALRSVQARGYQGAYASPITP